MCFCQTDGAGSIPVVLTTALKFLAGGMAATARRKISSKGSERSEPFSLSAWGGAVSSEGSSASLHGRSGRGTLSNKCSIAGFPPTFSHLEAGLPIGLTYERDLSTCAP